MDADKGKTDFIYRNGIRFTGKNAYFWEATKKGELLIHQCKSCGTKMFPPRLYCTSCMSQDPEWVKVSGKGKIHTYSVAYEYPPARVASFLSVPYVVALIDLEEGVRMMTNIVDCEPEDVKIGLNVEVKFEDIGEGVVLPKFRPAAV